MENEQSFPRVLTADQVRFEITRGFQEIPRSVQRDMLVKDTAKARKAQAAAVQFILARFEELQVRAPEPRPNLFHMGAGR
ncbi:hypothetical protein [Novosphingobium sp. TCA1]|uniref:hypothetical protein n=1 Tax=Novosphingobium sp. TCA1 TaxID=2682474 RepID=UPI001309CAD7|nr:hypothetical protein [Novosphingobium sp. TCA1]GFE73502.1 hypothetical protein NTCA1_11510 [Novosphingobium sp. TCA1]